MSESERERRESPFSQSIWESTKEEAGIVATAAVLGGVVGVGGGVAVAQIVGTSLVPSMVVGGVAGVTVGVGGGVMVAHRIHEASAEAKLASAAMVREATGKDPLARSGFQQTLATAVAEGVRMVAAENADNGPPPALPAGVEDVIRDAVASGIEAGVAESQRLQVEAAGKGQKRAA